MKYYLFVALCLISLAAGQVMAQEPENDEQLKVLSDTELRTEGAATRKPLDKGDDSKEGGIETKEDGKTGEKIKAQEGIKSAQVPCGTKKNIVSFGVGRLSGALKHYTYGNSNKLIVGDTAYNISGVNRSSVETELPLETYIFFIKDTIKFDRKWEVSLSVKKNLGKESDTGKGDERGLLYFHVYWWPDPDSLDIKWEADSELDLLMVEVDLKYRLYSKSGFSLSTRLGYIQKHLNFNVDSMYYYTPSIDGFNGSPSPATAIPRMLRQYSFIYDIPYAEIVTAYQLNNRIKFSASIGYAPYITIENDAGPMPIPYSPDSYLNNNGNADGNAIMLSAEGEYIFYKNWIMSLKAEYIKTETSGNENRYYSGLWFYDFKQEVESEEIYIFVEAAYEF